MSKKEKSPLTESIAFSIYGRCCRTASLCTIVRMRSRATIELTAYADKTRCIYKSLSNSFHDM